MAGKSDKYANIAYLYAVEAVAGTIAYGRLDMANNLLSEKAAIVIARADVFLGNLGAINAAGESVVTALTLSDRLTALSLQEPEVLFMHSLARYDQGAAASGVFEKAPATLDFSTLPGGGILVPADRLYIAVQSANLGALANAAMRLYYTVQPLAISEYWELVEARRIMTT